MEGQSAAKLRSKIKGLIASGVRICRGRFTTTELQHLQLRSNNLSEACYLEINNMNPPRCPVCGAMLKFRCISLGYRRFCSCSCKNRFIIDNTDINSRISKSAIKYHNSISVRERNRQQELRRQTLESRGKILPRSMASDFEQYKMRVKHHTELTRIAKSSERSLEIQLDHMYSVSQGFRDSIVPWVIGSECNLRLISRSENASKNCRCNINKGELFNLYFEESSETIPYGSTLERVEAADTSTSANLM